jgi:hypothetical protein
MSFSQLEASTHPSAEDGSAHEERGTNFPINLKKCAKTVHTKNEKQYIMVKVNGAANKPTSLQP